MGRDAAGIVPMNKAQLVIFALVAFLAGLAGAGVWTALHPGRGTEAARTASAYERVMRTMTLRCGYVLDPPHLVKDPATGTMSGPIFDIVTEAGRLLDLKIDWTEELGWGTTIEAVKAGRVDAVCTDFWISPREGRALGYTTPIYYAALGAFARQDDHRFDATLEGVNDPSVTVSTSDGEMSGIVASEDFPKARLLSLPNMTEIAQNLMNVQNGKADITFVDAMIGERFMRSNPGTLKNVAADRPVRVFPVALMVPQGDLALKTTLDSALMQMLNGGRIDAILRRYNLPPTQIYRVAKPYALPSHTE